MIVAVSRTIRDVFYNFPMEGNLSDHPDHTERFVPEKKLVSREDDLMGKRWRSFLGNVPRKDVEWEIIQRTVDDPKFRYDFVRNPKETLENFVGLKIPDGVKVEIIQEKPGDYKLVLPYIGRPGKKETE
jgi:hypothetical protein